MSTLNDRFQYVWYGTCSESNCTDLKFSDMTSEDLSKIDTISTFNDSGMIKYTPSSSEQSSLDKFTCGKMYLVTLNHSAVTSGGMELPNSLASSSVSSVQKYGISTTCSENVVLPGIPTNLVANDLNSEGEVESNTVTFVWDEVVGAVSYDFEVKDSNLGESELTSTSKTITFNSDGIVEVRVRSRDESGLIGNWSDYYEVMQKFVDCIPEGYTTLTDTGSSQIIEGLGTIAFYDPGKFGYKTSDFPEIEGLSRRATINAPDGFTLVDITLQAWPTEGETPTVYFDCTSEFCDKQCYSGKLTPIDGTDNWQANLTL